MAGVNPVGIVDSRIGLSDAGCIGGAAKLRLGDLGEGVSRLHRELGCGPNGRDRRRQNNLRAGHNVIRVEDARIGDDQIVPPESVTKVLLGKFPE